MARITIGQVKTTLGIQNTYDIVNAIRNSASTQFQQYVPLANEENIAEVGAGLLTNQALQNEFITSLVDRIGLVVIKSALLENPLKKFKKGMLPLGRTIEEIFVDIASEQAYDMEVAESQVFKREIPDVKTIFHERNRQGFYKKTISDDALRTAFISWGNFDDFLSKVINSIYNGAELDEFKYMKLIMDNYASKGLFKFIEVTDPMTSDASAKAFVKQVRATAQKMTLPMGSREFNAMAVHTRTDMDDLHLIIDADLQATMDVDVLASAFNMGKAEFLGHVTVIDNFATTGLKAVLVDKEFFMVYDQLYKMETIRNPQGLYYNYYLHVWQVLSASRFGNAVAFVTDSASVPPISQVIVTPNVASAKQGATVDYKAFVRETKPTAHTVAWTVTAMDGQAITGTTITNGVLKVGASQPVGRLLVKATATYDTDKTTIGEAVITIY